MNTLITRLASTALLLVSLPLHAITISLNPASQTVTDGSSVAVAVVVSGLGSGAAPSIGTFNLDVGFDSSIMGFSGAVFGDPGLGVDQLDLFGLGNLITVTPGSGTVNLYELSFDTADDLNALQADSFTLATLTFGAISTGTSPLSLTINTLGDAMGDPLTAYISNGSITVIGNTNSTVPEPAIWPLYGIGILAMGLLKRGRPSLTQRL